ncbi:hypothetical protein HK101_004115, partial [Irineochytrium annulatum]
MDDSHGSTAGLTPTAPTGPAADSPTATNEDVTQAAAKHLNIDTHHTTSSSSSSSSSANASVSGSVTKHVQLPPDDQPSDPPSIRSGATPRTPASGPEALPRHVVRLGRHRRGGDSGSDDRSPGGSASLQKSEPPKSAPGMIAPPTTPFKGRAINRSSTMMSMFTASEAEKDHPYSTIDFEEPDGPVLREHYLSQKSKTRIKVEIAHYIFAALITIVITLMFCLLFFSTETLGDLRIEWFASHVERGETGKALLIAIGTSLLASVIPAFVIVAWAPGAVGSGMTEILTFLNGSHAFQGQTWVQICARYLGSFGVVVSGLFSGFDGPMARIGAGVAIRVVMQIRRYRGMRSLFYGEDPAKKADESATNDRKSKIGWKAVLSVLEQKRLRMYATLGASVAIAAIFRAPLGGVMFAIEETTSFFEPSLLIKTLFATIISYLLVGYTVMTPSSGDGPLPSQVTTRSMTLYPTDVDCEQPTVISDFVFYIFIGVIAALLGTVWNNALGRVQRLRMKHVMTKAFSTNLLKRTESKATPRQRTRTACIRLAEVAVVAVVTSVVVVTLPL